MNDVRRSSLLEFLVHRDFRRGASDYSRVVKPFLGLFVVSGGTVKRSKPLTTIRMRVERTKVRRNMKKIGKKGAEEVTKRTMEARA